jgi:glycosyl transferase, family 25
VTSQDESFAGLHCYVVNLRRRADRRAALVAQLPSGLPVSFTSDWPVEIDGRLLDRAGLAAAGIRLHPWRIESDNPWWGRPLKWGEVGCVLAHMSCWRAAADSGVGHAVVLEDDAELRPGWLEKLQSLIVAGREFDLLYLGRVPLGHDRPTEDEGVVVPDYSHCTYGYVLSRAGLDAVLSAGLDRAVIPVDEFLPALYVAHPRRDVRELYPPRLRALAFDPPVVAQRLKGDAGTDTEASLFVDSSWPHDGPRGDQVLQAATRPCRDRGEIVRPGGDVVGRNISGDDRTCRDIGPGPDSHAADDERPVADH